MNFESLLTPQRNESANLPTDCFEPFEEQKQKKPSSQRRPSKLEKDVQQVDYQFDDSKSENICSSFLPT
jgi:hypothetical protein